MGAMELDIGVAVMTTYADGYLGVQVDAYGEGESGLAPGDGHNPYGFIGRPLDANAAGVGSLILRANEGSVVHAWCCDDSRDRPKLPLLTKGSSAQYNSRGSFFLLDYATAKAIGYYPNKAGSAAQLTTCDPESGEMSMVNTDGSYVISKAGEGTTIMSANGLNWIRVNDSGITLNGAVQVLGGMVVGNPATALPVLVGLSGPAGVGSVVFKASPTP